MLDCLTRESRGRVLRWTPWEGAPTQEGPFLWHMQSNAFESDLAVQIGNQPASILLRPAGTWFHPETHEPSPTVIDFEPPQPAPTSVVQVVPAGEEVAIWWEARGWASDPTHTTRVLIEAKTQAGEHRILYAPGLGTPADYAVWAYLGVDAFDTVALQRAALEGLALTRDGELKAADLAQILGVDTDAVTPQMLYEHSLQEARIELKRIAQLIGQEKLRSHAEKRALNRAWSVEWLRRVDREHHYLEASTPTHRTTELSCMGFDSLYGPEVERFRARMRDRYQPPASADILVLLPCSARKPYALSQSHRYMIRAIEASGIRSRVHEVMVTSPLGLVPRELEDVYPANAYDVPVTGHWNRDEEAIMRHQLMALLDSQPYTHVLAHVPSGTFSFLRDILPEQTLHTSQGRPSSIENCESLTVALKKIATDGVKVGWARRNLDDAKAILSYQFGPDVAAELTHGNKVAGKPPFRKLLNPEGVQLGMQSQGRTFFSLSLEGASVLARKGTYRVQMQDFEVKKTSNLFAVGVNGADQEVRQGDEVVVLCGEEIRGCGVAKMNANEMGTMRRGVAVNLRRK